MQYFKNSELAQQYPVTEGTVRNWIRAAGNGTLDLTLCEKDGKRYIANTPKNLAVIEELVRRARTRINKRYLNHVRPSSEFYKHFSPRQVLDIIDNIQTYREIPHGYSYFDGGAEHWDSYATELLKDDDRKPNLLTRTIELLGWKLDDITRLVQGHQRVNVIDLGVGNGLPVKDLLSHLLELGVLHRYIGIDLSQAMLDVAERNIKEWFTGQVTFEGHVRDINYDYFDDLVVDDYLENDEPPLNIVLLLGGTITNLRASSVALRMINKSVRPDDLFICTLKLDTEQSRRYFDFGAEHSNQPLAEQDRFILDLLNIDESLYDTEQAYFEEKRARLIRIKLKERLSIEFKFEKGARVIGLNRNDKLLLWRYNHRTAPEVLTEFEHNDFAVLEASQTKDHEYLLVIAERRIGTEK
jgi:uncharacterized SAM-dependent methyltransferase